MSREQLAAKEAERVKLTAEIKALRIKLTEAGSEFVVGQQVVCTGAFYGRRGARGEIVGFDERWPLIRVYNKHGFLGIKSYHLYPHTWRAES